LLELQRREIYYCGTWKLAVTAESPLSVNAQGPVFAHVTADPVARDQPAKVDPFPACGVIVICDPVGIKPGQVEPLPKQCSAAEPSLSVAVADPFPRIVRESVDTGTMCPTTVEV
jgi:hypothetical protein